MVACDNTKFVIKMDKSTSQATEPEEEVLSEKDLAQVSCGKTLKQIFCRLPT